MTIKNREGGIGAESWWHNKATRSTELKARSAIHGSFFRILLSFWHFSGADKAIWTTGFHYIRSRSICESPHERDERRARDLDEGGLKSSSLDVRFMVASVLSLTELGESKAVKRWLQAHRWHHLVCNLKIRHSGIPCTRDTAVLRSYTVLTIWNLTRLSQQSDLHPFGCDIQQYSPYSQDQGDSVLVQAQSDRPIVVTPTTLTIFISCHLVSIPTTGATQMTVHSK